MASRIESALAARKNDDDAAQIDWIGAVSGSTGVPVPLLQQIWSLYENAELVGSAEKIVQTLLSWIEEKQEYLFELIRPENIAGLFGEEYKKLETDRERAEYALPSVKFLLSGWLSGISLSEIEKQYQREDDVGLCKTARHFALRVVPDLAFVGGLPAQLLRAKALHEGGDPATIPMPTVIAVLPSIIHEGCDSVETVATRLNLTRTWSRTKSREQHEKYAPYILGGESRGRFRGDPRALADRGSPVPDERGGMMLDSRRKSGLSAPGDRKSCAERLGRVVLACGPRAFVMLQQYLWFAEY